MSAFDKHVSSLLDSVVHRDMRWCSKCGGLQLCLEIYESDGGRLISCQGCGDERIERFTRTTGEAA
jgi:hypothetical protein